MIKKYHKKDPSKYFVAAADEVILSVFDIRPGTVHDGDCQYGKKMENGKFGKVKLKQNSDPAFQTIEACWLSCMQFYPSFGCSYNSDHGCFAYFVPVTKSSSSSTQTKCQVWDEPNGEESPPVHKVFETEELCTMAIRQQWDQEINFYRTFCNEISNKTACAFRRDDGPFLGKKF